MKEGGSFTGGNPFPYNVSLNLSWAEKSGARGTEQPWFCGSAGLSVWLAPGEPGVGTAARGPARCDTAVLGLLLQLFPVGCARHLP